MELKLIEDFLLWCLLINSFIYIATSIATQLMRDFICRIHKKLFNYDEAAVLGSIQNYLSHYKLLITVFNFTPWLAVVIIS